MATVAQTKLLTAEDFMAADLGEGNFELVRGEIVELPPAMPKHGVVCANVAGSQWDYGRRSGYGYALSNDSAVVTERDPDTVRGPDVCFYSHARLPRAEVAKGLPPVPPDLAVEVLSEWNTDREMSRKRREYFDAGVRLVWMIDPTERTVHAYTATDHFTTHGVGDILDGGEVLPGFRLPIREWFERAERPFD